MRLFVAILSLMSITCAAYAQDANQPTNVDPNKAIAIEKIKKTVGKIIAVSEDKGSLIVEAVCVASVHSKNQILTSASCLDKNRYARFLYFDIDGLTSNNLGAEIEKLQIDGKIPLANLRALNKILKPLPYVNPKETKIHKSYTFESRTIYAAQEISKTPQILLQKARPDLYKAGYDIAIVALGNAKKLKADSLPTQAANDNEIVYVPGFIKADLKSSIQILTCEVGSNTLQKLITDLETRGNQNGVSAIDKIYIQESKNLYQRYNQTALLLACDQEIKDFTTGANIVIRNGSAYAVGVSSTNIISTRVEEIKNVK